MEARSGDGGDGGRGQFDIFPGTHSRTPYTGACRTCRHAVRGATTRRRFVVRMMMIRCDRSTVCCTQGMNVCSAEGGALSLTSWAACARGRVFCTAQTLARAAERSSPGPWRARSDSTLGCRDLQYYVAAKRISRFESARTARKGGGGVNGGCASYKSYPRPLQGHSLSQAPESISGGVRSMGVAYCVWGVSVALAPVLCRASSLSATEVNASVIGISRMRGVAILSCSTAAEPHLPRPSLCGSRVVFSARHAPYASAPRVTLVRFRVRLLVSVVFRAGGAHAPSQRTS